MELKKLDQIGTMTFLFLEITLIWTEKSTNLSDKILFKQKNSGDQFIFRAKFLKSFLGKKFGAPPNHFELLRPCLLA